MRNAVTDLSRSSDEFRNCMQRGFAAIQSRNPANAREWFVQALAFNPSDAQAHACLGQSLCWLGQREDGLAHLHQAGRLLAKKARKNRDTSLLLGLVDQLHFWHDYEGASVLAKQATEINRADVRGFQLLALSYSQINQSEQALAAGHEALKRAPDSAMLTILVAMLENNTKRYSDARRRLERLLPAALTAEERFRAHKELARALDSLRCYDQVFPLLHAAADIAYSIPEIRKQDASLVPRLLTEHKAGFDRELLSRWSDAAFQPGTPAPVFLIGFMRSGTTLTQEVLGAHPDVFVSDETNLLAGVYEELCRMVPASATTADKLRGLDHTAIAHLRQFYWNKARQRHGRDLDGRRLVDKTTMNTIDLGLINCVFPDAKIVFVMRDPRDVCLSCFTQTMVPTPSTVQLLSWERTAHFYAQVMDWWMTVKERMTLAYVEFRYEDAVSDFEATYRRVFEFLGLAWDPAVVDFHKRAAGRHISGPSHTQVAQPLYATSVARWRRYEREFGSVNEILQPFVTAFGYE